MRLKCYLRGLGIGVVVTAIIMNLFVSRKPASMTDAEVIARAKELGMVDGVLTELSETGEEVSPESEDGSEEAAGEHVSEEEDDEDEEDGPQETDSEIQTPDEEQPDAENVLPETDGEAEEGQPEEPLEDENEPVPSETVATTIVSVYPGEGSHTVSRKLANLGLVESADIFDDFLCQNGYDKKLCAGNYEIPEGATAHEIAKALTGE